MRLNFLVVVFVWLYIVCIEVLSYNIGDWEFMYLFDCFGYDLLIFSMYIVIFMDVEIKFKGIGCSDDLLWYWIIFVLFVICWCVCWWLIVLCWCWCSFFCIFLLCCCSCWGIVWLCCWGCCLYMFVVLLLDLNFWFVGGGWWVGILRYFCLVWFVCLLWDCWFIIVFC